MARDKAKVVATVEALLRKAESTNFGAEAESLIAKAHSLMLRYSIEEAVLRVSTGAAEDVTFLTITVQKNGFIPHERAVLLSVVAKHNHCRAIIVGNDGQNLNVYGYKTDCEFVKIMYQSLGMQLVNSLAGDGELRKSTTKQRSFAEGFTASINSRLEAMRRVVEEEVAPEGSSTALVLVKKDEMVSEEVRRRHPSVKVQRQSIKRDQEAWRRGWDEGRKADIAGRDRKVSEKEKGELK